MKKHKDLIEEVYLKALIPNILLVLGGTVNVFFDGILVGQRIGDNGLDSINQCLPFYLILCTVGSLIASGVMTLSAIAAGNNDLDESKRYYSVGLFLSVVSSVVVCGLAYIFLGPITSLISIPATYDYAYEYLKITIIFGIFKVLIYNFTFYLRIEGKLKRSSFSMILMTVMNIVLDYVFLFIFDMGVKGAALASGIATFVACAFCFIFLYTDKPIYNLGFKLPKKGDLKKIVVQGSSMALNNITSSLRIFCFNLIFKQIGISELGVIFAIISNLNECSICVQSGVPQTGTAMLAILFGGKEYTNIKNLINKEIQTGFWCTGIVSAIFIIFSSYIPSIFGSEISCNFAIICFAISILFATNNSVFTFYYSSIQRITIADIMTLLRGLILPVGFCYLLSFIPEYIWLLYPLTEIVCFGITYLITANKKYRPLTKLFLLDEEYEKSGQIYSRIVDANSEAVSKATVDVNEFLEQYELTPKKAMAVNLSIEEILMIITEKSLKHNGQMDLRVFKKDDDVIIRIRSAGDYYNPFAENDEGLDYLGVTMIQKIATKIDYQSTLGINTLIIII